MSKRRGLSDEGGVYRNLSSPFDLTRQTVVKVTSRLFTSKTWLEQYGKPHYKVRTRVEVNLLCKSESERTLTAPCLPPGWDTRQLGNRWYIFHDASDERSSSHIAPTAWGWPQNRIPLDKIEPLRAAASRQLIIGEQKRLAERLMLTESNLSRLIKRFREVGTDITIKPLPHPSSLGVPSVKGPLVDAVMSVLFTIQEWTEHVGSRKYGINDVSYAGAMAAGRTWGNSTSPASLPQGWLSVRVGDTSSLIFHHSIMPKARWLIP